MKVFRAPLLTFFAVITLFFVATPTAHAASDEYVYTKSYGGEIFKKRLDNSGSWTQVGTIGTGNGLMIHGNYIYLCWPSIKRMALDGTGLVTLTSSSTSYNCATDGTYIYYGYETTQAIGRMNLDGTGKNDSWVTFSNSGLNSGWISVSNGFIYFGGGVNATSKALGKVSTSGGAVSLIYTDPCAITGIASDATNIYLSHYNCGNVSKLGTDGTVVTSTFMSGLTYQATWAAQIWNGYLYVLDTLNVARIKLDGTGFSSNYITGAGSRGMAISGTLNVPTTLSSTSLPASLSKGVSSTMSATFSAAGKVTFFSNGKRIQGCIKVSTASNAPYTASCTWKAVTQGSSRLTASIAPTDSANLAATVELGSRAVSARRTQR